MMDISDLKYGSAVHDATTPERDNSLSWLDKHRPRRLEDVALDPMVRERLEGILVSGLGDHLVLHGPSGTGKSTVADIIAERLYGNDRDRVLRIKAAQTRNVEFVRNRVLTWMNASGGLMGFVEQGWTGLMIFSEADGLSADAQAALKDALEDFRARVKVIFTTNNLACLDPAILSRSVGIEMMHPPLDERARALARILAAEGLQVELADALQFATHFEDMRQLLMAARDSFGDLGTLRTPEGTLIAGWDVWPEPVDGAQVLDGIASVFSRYLSLPKGSPEALALWVVFTHSHEAFGYSPILVARSPAMRSGKTRLFEILELLAPRCVFTSNITPAAIFRLGGLMKDDQDARVQPPLPPALTLLADEGDTWLKLRPEIQGVLNSGHTRRAAYVVRVVQEEARRFSTWFPKAVALIDRSAGQLPGTVLDRSILIPMQRRRQDEVIAEWRSDQPASDLLALRRQAARWAHDNFYRLRHADPPVAERLQDRAKDNWRPLLAVASLAGGRWPEAARAASLILSGIVDETRELTILLLGDIRSVFESHPEQANWLPTAFLVATLRKMEDRPWSESLTPWQLSQMMRPFGIRSKAAWGIMDSLQKRTLRGYFLRDFDDTFARYAPRPAQP